MRDGCQTFLIKYKKAKQLLSLRLEAFSLLELSIVLLIMGVMISVSLPFFTSQYESEKNKKTDETLKQLAHTLAHHVLLYGRLPCAADPAAKGENMGQEVAQPCNLQGIIPYKTLGISPSLIRDGEGHFITYAVDPTFTQKRPLNDVQNNAGGGDDNVFAPVMAQAQGSYCEVASLTGFKIYDEQKQLITEDPLKQPIFVLVSHGKKGGFFLEGGARKPAGDNDFVKIENMNNDGSFVDAPISKDHDDKIFWRDRFSFLSIFGNFHCPPR